MHRKSTSVNLYRTNGRFVLGRRETPRPSNVLLSVLREGIPTPQIPQNHLFAYLMMLYQEAEKYSTQGPSKATAVD